MGVSEVVCLVPVQPILTWWHVSYVVSERESLDCSPSQRTGASCINLCSTLAINRPVLSG